MGVPRKVLPAKTYEGGPRSEPTLRYFVDKFPLFLDRTESLPCASLISLARHEFGEKSSKIVPLGAPFSNLPLLSLTPLLL
jgi:hypothetical protein